MQTKNKMETHIYNVTFTRSTGEILSDFSIEAANIKEARQIAQRHKRLTPEISKHRHVSTEVRRAK